MTAAMTPLWSWEALSERASVEFAADVTAYLRSRWSPSDDTDEVAGELLAAREIGWSAGLQAKGLPWLSSHPLLLPLRDPRGRVLSVMRRWHAPAKPPENGKKTLRLKNAHTLVDPPLGEKDHQPQMWYGSLPEAVGLLRADPATVLYLVEGEVDYLLVRGLVLARKLRGAVIGIPGGAGNSSYWWDALVEALRDKLQRLPAQVVLCFDPDEAGDGYAARALGRFPTARSVPLPRGKDLTDVAKQWGLQAVLGYLRTPRRDCPQWWILDDGLYAYSTGEVWNRCKRGPLFAHIRETGLDEKAAKDVIGNLPVASGLVFDPSTTEPVVWSRPPKLNTYGGIEIRRDDSVDAGPLTRLIWHLVGGSDMEAYQYVLDWLAAPLQSLAFGRGATRTQMAPVFYGTQGSGKGLFSLMLASIYGRYFLQIGQEQLEDKYAPEGMDQCLVLNCNEVTTGHAGRYEGKLLNRLKPYVTDPRIQVRDMWSPAQWRDVWFNVYFTSNAVIPVRIEMHDRRYSFFEQRAKLPIEIRQDVVAQIKAGWPGVPGLVDHLLTRPVSRSAFEPFENAARARQRELSAESQEAFCLELADAGIRAVAQPWNEEQAARHKAALPEKTWLQTGADPRFGGVHGWRLQEIYLAWAKVAGYRQTVTQDLLGECLQRMVPGVERARLTIDGHQMRGFRGVPVRPPTAEDEAAA